MLHDLIDEYLTERGASAWDEKTVRHHRSILGIAARFLAERGRQRWADVDGADLDAVLIDGMARGLRRKSRDAYAWSLRSFGRWLMERGKVLRDPAAYLHVPADDEVPLPPAPLTEAQVADILAMPGKDDVTALRLRLHLDLLYSCGLRNAEACDLDVRDLDMDGRTVLVREGKFSKTRMLPMMPATLDVAADYLAMRRELLRGPDHGALLLTKDGKRVPLHGMQQWLKKASRRLGYRVHPHLLRHSIAVHLLRRGADIRHIQEFLGHADLETTKVYLRLVPAELREDYDDAMPVLLAVPGSPGAGTG
jgi:integrase/recombinase XerD